MGKKKKDFPKAKLKVGKKLKKTTTTDTRIQSKKVCFLWYSEKAKVFDSAYTRKALLIVNVQFCIVYELLKLREVFYLSVPGCTRGTVNER